MANRLQIEDKLDFIGGVLEDINTTLQGDTSNPIYGVKRSLSSSSTSWVRTDNSVGLSANATKTGGSVDNDFDNIYPWSDIISVNILNDEVVAKYGDDAFKFDGTNGDVMTHIPSFYIKRWQDTENEYVQIAHHHFEGSTKVEDFYIGRYTTSSGVKSISGVTSTVSQNIATFRNQARTKGTKWSQLDWRLFAIQYLYLVEFANADSQAVLGNGVSGVSAQVSSGGCDALGMKSGSVTNDSGHAVIYRGIENIFGNIWQFVDGINIKDYKTYICYDIASYVSDKFDAPYTALSYTNASANGNPKKMGCDPTHPLVGITEEVGTSVYGDYYWQASGNRIVLFGGPWGDGADDGMFYLSCSNDSSTANAYIGSRLLRTH